ncbi:MAG: SAM-dependent methyltransferase [Opitutae bacterium]|nr:SAM-dependent methyltransferase [Opitutae bacterium]
MNSNLQDILKQVCSKSPITYKEYIQTVLYHPEYGYYSKQSQRVGRSSQTDFYTSESLGKVFAQLVLSAAKELLKTKDLSTYHFIEIGAEPNASLLTHLEKSPFRKESVIRPYNKLNIEDGPIVLFANEWLDAQPFHRLVFLNGQWYEKAITLNSKNELEETLLKNFSKPIQSLAHRFPKDSINGYQVDLSPKIENDIKFIMDQKWTGLVMFFDYGKTWQEISTQMPNGSARTYHKHKQGTDLLKTPGECDITFDICWDFIKDIINSSKDTQSYLQSQESFFVHHAQEHIKKILSNAQFSFSQEKQTLLELIHPANMGQKFQTLHALRK